MKLSEISVKRPVFATMMILSLLVVGWFSYTGLPVELFPNVDFPFVIVQTVYPGASAESVETELTKPLEEVINQISGVRHIQSTSTEGFSLVLVEFQLDVEGPRAAQDVRDKIAGVKADLPDDAEEPVVVQWDSDAEPILSLAVSGKRPLRDITELAEDKIKTRLEVIRGVGSVELIGDRKREILVALNPGLMEAHSVSIDEVVGAIQAANLEVPGGRVDEASQEYVVRLMGRLDRPSQFNDVIVKTLNDRPVYLSDVARVIDTTAEQRSLSRYNGVSAIGMNVIKQSGSNVVQMAEEAKKVLEELRAELPPDIDIRIVADESTFITDSIHEILFNIQFGTLLAVIVIFLFLLDFRPTIITGLSIPISIIATFTLISMLGFTINFMTLLGLSLAVGILVDDAIVVVENIYRHLDEGKSAFRAAIDGTKEIGLAVSATTFTIMVVFLPVAFMEGIVGRFFYQFGMTVAFSVGVSLFVAFTLTPMLASRWFKGQVERTNEGSNWFGQHIWLPIRRVLSVWNMAFDATLPFYKGLLRLALGNRGLVLIVATGTFVLAIYMASGLGTEFIPEHDEGQLVISVETPPGTTLEETSERLLQIEAIMDQIPEVKGIYVTIGGGNNPVTKGSALIQLVDQDQRQISAQQLIDSTRSLIDGIPGIKFSVAKGQAEGGSEKPVEFSIRGDDREELTRLAHVVQQYARVTPNAIDIDNTLEEGKPEIQIQVDRKAAEDLGVNLATIPSTVRMLVEGDDITRYKEGDEEYDVRIRLDEQFRSSLDDVSRILVRSTKEVEGRELFLVPLGRVASLHREYSIGEYRRFDRQNEVRVNANVGIGGFAGTVSQQIQLKVDSLELAPGYEVSAVGEQEIMTESFTNIIRALLLAVIFIYLVLASQYESFWDPLSIMISLPLSLIGAVMGLLFTNTSLSIMSMIGIVMLMGLVTKNAILLIDFVKQQRQRGVARSDAVLIAGPIRLRPILMTTLATIFGMLPLALALGPGAEMRAPMARAAIGGMISSTVLTLVVVPVVYTVIDDIVGWFARLFGITQKHVEMTELNAPALDEQLDRTQ